MLANKQATQDKTADNEEFVKKHDEKVGGKPPEDSADAYAAGQFLQAAVEAVGSIDDQQKLADWIRGHTVATILGDLKWNEDGSPIGEFLIGQWQNGKVQFVLPSDIATTDHVVQGWKPGGGA